MEDIQARLQRAVRDLEITQATLQEVVPHSGDWVWLPLLGVIPAGYPQWEGDQLRAEEFYPCSASAVGDPEHCYALRVMGECMAKRGILDQDIVFIDPDRTPRSNDMVIARRDDEVVLRIYVEEAGEAYLEAANENYPVLRLIEGRIMGVVVGSYRENP